MGEAEEVTTSPVLASALVMLTGALGVREQ